ncbi:pimeloyl-ACP methyl ester carboxylesterase [Kribbella sp. VKM Ac-2571]|uniref:alpha/beta fold hydrolase n=1 Tax=Kribbella sp. VKM Ac-2571 TaxID=2512222 RepID=UPI00105C1276|nr:alpha/beta hydrolase [Kribbella sp. VKM Ac-2571]TDO52964.1 pimeloyl-ACP methyl ester carboxylesterase [Kribbella sp. VKM Ac-2571]
MAANVEARAVPIWLRDAGTGDPLLLVHGWGGDSRAWSGLGFEDRRVIAVDLRGHGRSPVLRHGYRPADYAADLAALVERLGLRPVVAIGHSMGGQIVAELALERPDLVAAVVVIDPAYGADEAEAATFEQRLAALRNDGSDAAVRQLGLRAGAVRDQLLATPGHVLAESYAGMYTDPDAFGARPAAATRLAALTQPLLSIRPTPAMAAWDISLSLPYGSRVALWNGCSHFLHHERPRQFVALVDSWLTSLADL